MAGETTSGSLADSMPVIIDSARIRREYPPVCAKLFEYHKLDENTGLSWDEVEFGRFTAQTVTETTRLTNYQQYADTLRTLEPTMSGLATLVTDKTYRRISKNAVAQMATLMQDALERKKDTDCLTTLDGATNSGPGTGATLSFGHITAHLANIEGNTTEGGVPPLYAIAHGWQWKDVADEITSGVGTYPIPAGMTEQVFRSGFRGVLDRAELYTDNNIPIVSNDAKGGVFARRGGLFIQGAMRKRPHVRDEEFGGGADKVFLYDEYISGERTPNAVSVLMRELLSDAPAPA